jgi:hypothetical protein
LKPFLASLSPSASERFILEVGYFGVSGHSGAVPQTIALEWLRAALVSSTFMAKDLIDMRYRMRAVQDTDPSKVHKSTGKEDSPYSDRDIELARFLASTVDKDGILC